ncbi:MAG: helix-turn-helix domain-containing protein [Bordetella sp.]|uniref:helix-turn-helix domain-containing protein n=1 Tax=Bordetella sp. TaxID=28081 RepID=UPI003F7B9B6D
MKSLLDLSELLRAQLKAQGISQRTLGARAGLARRTLENMLSGRMDYKITTLMSVLDRLGLELVVVPKEAAPGLADLIPQAPTHSAVKTRLQAAREALQARLDAEPEFPPPPSGLAAPQGGFPALGRPGGVKGPHAAPSGLAAPQGGLPTLGRPGGRKKS